MAPGMGGWGDMLQMLKPMQVDTPDATVKSDSSQKSFDLVDGNTPQMMLSNG
jgi:hypothetical protein